MATKAAQARRNDLPGSIYLNKNRYWWKVQLPGEDAPKARPLVTIGAKFATTDYLVAVELAKNIYQQSIYIGQAAEAGTPVSNIASLASTYLCHVDSYYLDGQGNPTKEPDNIRYSFKPLTDLFAALPVEEFGPLKLAEVRNLMIGQKWSRNLINQRIGRIKRMFKWAVSRQLLSPVVYQGLNTVEGLKRGRTTAEEPEKRKPANEKHVYAILPYTTPVVATMIELQLLTGMRPGELVIMRPCDIDRSDKVWHYTPTHHKTQYRGDDRIISIGPRGQELLCPYLLRGAESYCFSPAESEQQRLKKLHEQRTTRLHYGNRPGTNRVKDKHIFIGDCYTVSGYGHAVAHALKAANNAILKKAKAENIETEDKEKEIKKPVLIPHWTPYQLRHTAATKVRREMGYETAGATLGHTNMSATAIYAERNQGLADEAARRFG